MFFFKKGKHIAYRSEDEAVVAIFQTLVYIAFVTVTTIIALSGDHAYVYFFNQSVERLFLSRIISEAHDHLSYENLVTISEFWDFLQINFIEDLDRSLVLLTKQKHKFDTKLSPNKTTEDIVKGILTENNVLLGVPKLRQIRVKPGSCVIQEEFKQFFNNCYARYSYDAEDKSEFFKHTHYFRRATYNAAPVTGNVQTYNGPGYMELLSFNKQNNLAKSTRLKESNWIDYATRAVILELVIYNTDTQIFNNIKFIVEVLPTGGVLPRWDLRCIPLYTIWSPLKRSLLIAAVIFYLLIVYYTTAELQEMYEVGLRGYFLRTQNYVDLIILLSAYIYLTLTMKHPFYMDRYLQRITRNQYSLASLDEPCFWYFTTTFSMAICVFFVWAKIFRFIGFNRTMLQFSATLMRCAKDILGFGLMFIIVFIAFALFGMVNFGATYSDFATFQNAIFTMVRMVLGDFQYERIEQANRIIGPIFSLFYVILITFLMLNMFLAIINETYSVVKQEVSGNESAIKTVLLNFSKKLVAMLKRLSVKPTAADRMEYTPTPSGFTQQNDDLGSMYEYSDAPVKKNKISMFRRPFKQSDSTTEITPSEDHKEDLIRYTERIELLENLIKDLTANLNRVMGRPDTK